MSGNADVLLTATMELRDVQLHTKRKQSFVEVQKLHIRAGHDLNNEWVNDTHLNHEGVHIRKDSLCCGAKNAHGRTHLFHFLEGKSVRNTVLLLLFIDIVCVALEILLSARILNPSFTRATDEASLFVPKSYICHGIHHKTASDLTKCCEAHFSWYGAYAAFDSVAACFDAHNGTSIVLAKGGGHLRSLLSSAAAANDVVRCYDTPPGYKPHLVHYPIEEVLHYLSYVILLLFVVELGSLVYVFGLKQFFCSCHSKFAPGDTVVVEDFKENGFASFRKGEITHINRFTGDLDVKLNDDNMHYRDVPIVICKPVRVKACGCHVKFAPYILDFVVVYASFFLETANMVKPSEGSSSLVSPAQFLILFRLFRFVRVIHGLYEGSHHLKSTIKELKEFQGDTADLISNFSTIVSELKITKDGKSPDTAQLVTAVKGVQDLLASFHENYPSLKGEENHPQLKLHTKSFKHIVEHH